MLGAHAAAAHPLADIAGPHRVVLLQPGGISHAFARETWWKTGCGGPSTGVRGPWKAAARLSGSISASATLVQGTREFCRGLGITGNGNAEDHSDVEEQVGRRRLTNAGIANRAPR